MRKPANNAKTTPGRRGSGRPFQPGNPWAIKPGEVRNPSGRPTVKPIFDILREIIDRDPALASAIAHNALRQAGRNLGWFIAVRDMLDGKPDGKPTGSPDDPVSFNLNVTFEDPEQMR